MCYYKLLIPIFDFCMDTKNEITRLDDPPTYCNIKLSTCAQVHTEQILTHLPRGRNNCQ